MREDRTELFTFDGLTIRCDSREANAVYNDVMKSIRGYDVNDIIRESPAFTAETEH